MLAHSVGKQRWLYSISTRWGTTVGVPPELSYRAHYPDPRGQTRAPLALVITHLCFAAMVVVFRPAASAMMQFRASAGDFLGIAPDLRASDLAESSDSFAKGCSSRLHGGPGGLQADSSNEVACGPVPPALGMRNRCGCSPERHEF